VSININAYVDVDASTGVRDASENAVKLRGLAIARNLAFIVDFFWPIESELH
jgi:hypothetical protein